MSVNEPTLGVLRCGGWDQLWGRGCRLAALFEKVGSPKWSTHVLHAQVRWRVREYVYPNCMDRPDLCLHYEVSTAVMMCPKP